MKIGIDAREIQNGVYTGIGRSLANFLEYFSMLNKDDECILFSSKKIPLDFGRKVKNIVIEEGLTFYWDQVKLPLAMRRERVDIFYSPYYKVPLLTFCKVVSAILDLMYLSFKEYRKKLGIKAKLYYMSFGKGFAHKADRIITDSEHAKKEIVKFYKIAEDRIKIIPLSVNKVYNLVEDKIKIEETKEKYGINKRYILFVGNFKPHKNVKTLILAFKEITNILPDLELVLVGPKKNSYQELKTLGEDLSLQDKVIFTGKITNLFELKNLYDGAELFVMPSLYEGFGLPVAEAMACGLPVVASDRTSIPEVVGNAGILVNPSDNKAFVTTILNLLQDQQMRLELSKRSKEQANLFSEDRINKAIYDLFQEVYHHEMKL